MEDYSELAKAFRSSLAYNLPTYKDVALLYWDNYFNFYESALMDLFRLIDRASAEIVKLNGQPESGEDSTDDNARQQHEEAMVDFYSELIEVHLGSVLLLCQRYMTKKKESYKKFAKDHEESGKVIARKTDTELLQLGTETIAGIGTVMALINHLANYVKHADQWEYDWIKHPQNDNGINRETRKIIRLVIGKLTNKDVLAPPPLSSIMSILGVADMTLPELEKIVTHLRRWQDELYAIIEKTDVPSRTIHL